MTHTKRPPAKPGRVTGGKVRCRFPATIDYRSPVTAQSISGKDGPLLVSFVLFAALDHAQDIRVTAPIKVGNDGVHMGELLFTLRDR